MYLESGIQALDVHSHSLTALGIIPWYDMEVQITVTTAVTGFRLGVKVSPRGLSKGRAEADGNRDHYSNGECDSDRQRECNEEHDDARRPEY